MSIKSIKMDRLEDFIRYGDTLDSVYSSISDHEHDKLLK